MPPAPGAATAKQELRRRILEARRALSPEALATARAAVLEHILFRLDSAMAGGRPWRNVFAYEAVGSEPAGQALLEAMADRGSSIYVPLLRPDHDLDWFKWPESTTLGRQAVQSASVLLVPALAVDARGIRLGRGGGSYDRVLPRVPPDVPVIAVLHRGELLESVPHDPWDQPVRAVVTPDGWYDLPTR